MGNIANCLCDAVTELHNNFRKNHELKRSPSPDRVRIGRSNSLSYIYERAIAKSLSNVYQDYRFFVDYPVTLYQTNKRNPTIYLDILVIRGIDPAQNIKCGEVAGIIDLKIDLGYIDSTFYGLDKGPNFQGPSKFASREDNIKLCKRLKFHYIVGAYSDEEKELNKSRGPLEASITHSIKKICLICTQDNDHGRSEPFRKVMKAHNYEVLFLLEKGCHPNTGADISRKIKDQIMAKAPAIETIFQGL